MSIDFNELSAIQYAKNKKHAKEKIQKRNKKEESDIVVVNRFKEIRFIIQPSETYNPEKGILGLDVYDKLLMRNVFSITTTRRTLEEVLDDIGTKYKQRKVIGFKNLNYD